jgi:hypothetical protein
MSWNNAHRKATRGQKLLWAVTGIGIGVLAGKKPTWQKTVGKTLAARRKAAKVLAPGAVPIDWLPDEERVEEMVAALSFEFGGVLDERGREVVDTALRHLAYQLTGHAKPVEG